MKQNVVPGSKNAPGVQKKQKKKKGDGEGASASASADGAQPPLEAKSINKSLTNRRAHLKKQMKKKVELMKRNGLEKTIIEKMFDVCLLFGKKAAQSSKFRSKFVKISIFLTAPKILILC